MQRSAVRPSPLFFAILALAIAGGLLAAFSDATSTRDPMLIAGVFILIVGGWAVSLTLHEFGHAFVAYKGGDHSVLGKGYLNLDVRHYTDPVLSLVLPLILLAIGGIPLPGGAVWINRWALRSRGISTWVSLAGPLSNLLFGVLLTVAVAYIPMPVGLAIGLSYLALLQVFAFVLNILPIPGLDGFGAIEPYLSPQTREFAAKVRPWAPLALFALLFAVPNVAAVFQDLSGFVYEAIGGDRQDAYAGQITFMFWRY
ncbi:site-2 protease family protein [Amycolatopsis alkalitolerans]|uniref:Site-2 protease family protein n=1 Tax=Amycolatopsis alkalitolerans TaxID=2547244 RepID=A0A5C4LTN4_9PSEU|nr:site-2 protease family protein [Amycolatopsis alkalitolerans]TNC21290.1 site-2 protease family protein [Amycolatopsis alkalitolerans]